MTRWNSLRSWLRSTVRRPRMESEMDSELRFHIEEYGGDLVRRGIPRDEAMRRARLEFGGLERVKEEGREARGVIFFDALGHDLRFGVRMLRKSPGFAAVAVLTLAVGIGANTAIFGVVDAVLLRPLAMRDPARVMYVEEEWRGVFPGLSVGNFSDILKSSASFSSFSASSNASFNLATEGTPERVDGEYVTADYFATFGVQPLAGRVFRADEDQPGHSQVVILSERLWRTRLHADPALVGQPIRINGLPCTVVGIMPKSFDPLLSASDLWLPEAFKPEQIADYDNHYLNAMGRLKPGVSPERAQAELNVIADRLKKEHPIDDEDRGLRLTPISTSLLGDQKLVLRMMLSAVGLVLLIACANLASLQLGRARARQKEIAVRAALGASPQRIIRQVLAENVLLGAAGGIVGVLLAYWGLAWIVTHGPSEVPRLAESRIDAAALAFACAVALVSSFLFGLAPALRAASTELSEAFKEGGRTSSGAKDRVRSALVVCEVALALVLMAGAGLLLRSALLVSRLDPGFQAANLVVGRVGLPTAEYADPAKARITFENMIKAADSLPGVASAAVVSRAPLAGGGSSNGLLAEGRPLDLANLVDARLQIVSPTYLSTVHIRLKAGRDFSPGDTRDKNLVTIVNETLARTLWPGESPIGKRLACCEAGPKGRMDPVWHEVVGLVGDVRASGLDRQVQPEFYIPLAQMPPSAWDWIGRTMDLVVRTQGGTVPVRDLQTTVASVAPGVPIYRLSTMEQKIAGTLERSHFDTFLLSVFAATALLLSSVGIYGVLAYLVTQRTRDIGIRMTLGATQGQILRDVISYGLRLALVGLAFGLIGAFAGTRLLSSLLYGIRATDVVTFSAVCLLLIVVALLASYLPARRATRVDPIVALRHD